jgi:hypothetical protein
MPTSPVQTKEELAPIAMLWVMGAIVQFARTAAPDKEYWIDLHDNQAYGPNPLTYLCTYASDYTFRIKPNEP